VASLIGHFDALISLLAGVRGKPVDPVHHPFELLPSAP
jgi:hypothetical protein